ncbi:Metallo-hydrolase/oxidoreductase [Trichoderma velutinum]
MGTADSHDHPVAPSVVSLHRLEGGFLHLPMQFFVQGADTDEIRRVPCMAWLIENHNLKKKVLFDMGLRKDIENYTPAVFRRLQTTTAFVLGPGASDLITGPKSYPESPDSHYDSQIIAKGHILSLPSADIIAPGHCPGHINALLWIESDRWVYLAGDTAHDSRILNGTKQMAVYRDDDTGGFKCAHVNKNEATLHLQRVRELKNYINVEVILSHDQDWLNANQHRF